jgi:superoxide reductase
MLEEHHISFIVVETNQGFHKKDLTVGEAPAAEFALTDGEKAVAVYEYCNLHGLWKKDL